MNAVDMINIQKGRDVSPYLFHFVKGDNPIYTLKKILNDDALLSKRNDFICFTESPLRAMWDVLCYFKSYDTPMYQPYGIGIKKEIMYKKYGARPVIYGNNEDIILIDESLKWRFETLDFDKHDFSWLREWRVKGRQFGLPDEEGDVVIICKNENECSPLNNEFGKACISFEYIEENHATDFDVEGYSFFQMLSDDELDDLKQECEELKSKHLKY